MHYVGELARRGKYADRVAGPHDARGNRARVSVVGGGGGVLSQRCPLQPNAVRDKGEAPLTEHYSVLGPEVLVDQDGDPTASKNQAFWGRLMSFDAVIIAGQAKSHCVAWTIDDLFNEIVIEDAGKVYLLEDCTSAVVVPGVVDFTDQADRAFRGFSDAGMNLVRSFDPIENWPGVPR